MNLDKKSIKQLRQLILFTIVIFLKMKTGGRMNYKAGDLFLGSLVTGLLCEGMIASIRNNVLNPYSFAMDAFASSIQTLGFLVLLMGCQQIAGAVLAYQEKEVLAQRTADGSSEEHTVHHAGDTEEEICALVACFFAAYSLSRSMIGWLAAMFRRLSWGTQFRTSSFRSNFVSVVILPDSKPLAMGEKGTTPMLCSMQ